MSTFSYNNSSSKQHPPPIERLYHFDTFMTAGGQAETAARGHLTEEMGGPEEILFPRRDRYVMVTIKHSDAQTAEGGGGGLADCAPLVTFYTVLYIKSSVEFYSSLDRIAVVSASVASCKQ
ncbi:hypothetical protein RRG08_053966 [Elysia crispata]|uniref:Uncharacterized protein n=1 Tax=Elysia crispata TaxID=231223 RepID=A0AAE0ZEF8_9GAST|nr:hypothetical protein RRG08_053966 [Elysia crispata]